MLYFSKVENSQDMKILLAKSYPKLSSVGHLATSLKNIGHEVHILVPQEHPDCDKMRALGITVHFIDIHSAPFPLNLSNAFKISKKLLKFIILLRKNSYDVVVLNLPEARLYGRVSSLFSKSAVVSIIRGFEIFYERKTNFIDDATVCVSEAVKKYVEANKIKNKNLTTIYNAVDLKTIDKIPVDKKYLHKKLNLNLDTKIIGMVSYFYSLHSKGHKTFIDATKIISSKFPTVRFVLVGSDIWGKGHKNYFEKYVRKLGLEDKIYFLGEREDIPQLMDSFYAHAFPTTQEGFGMVLIEAMSRGTPNVASKLEVFNEIFVSQESGLFFETSNSEELAKQLELLIENPDLAEKIGRAGRKRVEEKFDSLLMAYKYETLFKKVILEKSLKNKIGKLKTLVFNFWRFLF